MRLEFISPFVHSAHSVLETLLGAAPTRGEPSLQGKGFHVSEVLAMVGVVGDIEGTVICSMTRTVALGISGRMLGGARLRELGDLGRSAISDLATMISRDGAAELCGTGFECETTPATVIEGGRMRVTTVERTLCVPIESELGTLLIIVDLREATGR
ncbi:MAG: chemotaxis protein CheX [Armatimonadetes bacterium]|jgi:chemotaxis protein CheX|nr:chemotaxis protein CheX [Armatimonadota bacterium]MDI9600944.1 chemotaxis protein CheX [Acidobacteriota bacterium]